MGSRIPISWWWPPTKATPIGPPIDWLKPWWVIHAQACFFATQTAERALKGAIVELGLAPPHTHGLPKLVEVLEQQGVEASGLANLPLRALTRMTVTKGRRGDERVERLQEAKRKQEQRAACGDGHG
jgi:hypothetical protein